MSFSDFPSTLFLPGDSFDTDKYLLNGRRVAGKLFAQGISANLRTNEQLTIITNSKNDHSKLTSLLKPYLKENTQLIIQNGLDTINLNRLSNLHIPGPEIPLISLIRCGLPPNSFSLTGVIHSLSSNKVIDTIRSLLTAPLYPWDSLVCTSSVGKTIIQKTLEFEHQYLERRFDTSIPFPDSVKLPIIPLATNDPLTSKTKSREQLRSAARKELNLPQEAFIILFLGRLSWHSKAHPLPLYRAIARLSRENPFRKIFLLECGHFYNQFIAKSFYDLSESISSLNIRRVGGEKPATDLQKSQALEAADVFVSNSDNIQETFGISVIEAMAAGLPAIVSDWDGYKDLVVNNENGFRIPTHSVSDDNNLLNRIDLQYRLGIIDYDHMISIKSITTNVDEHALLKALETVLNDSNKLKQMGESARKRWKKLFTWEIVINSYRNLWSELKELREGSSTPKDVELPSVPPMTSLFSSYGSGKFIEERLICESNSTPPEMLLSPINTFPSRYLCGESLHLLVNFLNDNKFVDIQALNSIGIPIDLHQSVLAMIAKLGIASANRNI